MRDEDVLPHAAPEPLEHMHQWFNEVPEFFLYALAAGIKRAFARYESWETKAVVKKKDDSRIPHRRRREAVGYKECRPCRDGTNCRTSAQDSQGLRRGVLGGNMLLQA